MFEKLKKLLGVESPNLDEMIHSAPLDTPHELLWNTRPEEIPSIFEGKDSVKSIKIDAPNHLTDNWEIKGWDGRSWNTLLSTPEISDITQMLRLIFQPIGILIPKQEDDYGRINSNQ